MTEERIKVINEKLNDVKNEIIALKEEILLILNNFKIPLEWGRIFNILTANYKDIQLSEDLLKIALAELIEEKTINYKIEFDGHADLPLYKQVRFSIFWL